VPRAGRTLSVQRFQALGFRLPKLALPVPRAHGPPGVATLTGPKSCRINNGFVDQQNRDVVPHRVNAPALQALQAFSRLFELQRLLAHRADQNFEQILRNHCCIVRR
jgi:hypothetical protein